MGFSSGSEPDQPSQTYDLGGGQSVTFTYQSNPVYIDFSATIPLDYVVIKGGKNGHNVFHYDPPVTSDTGLYAPNNTDSPAGVSHVVVCFLPRPVASKTAAASWARDTQWGLQKASNPASIAMFDGDSHAVEYTVTATPTTRNTFVVSGNITITDAFNYGGFVVGSVVDAMGFTGDDTLFHARWPEPATGDKGAMRCDNGSGNVLKTCSYSFELNKAEYTFLRANLGGHNAVAVSAVRDGRTTITTALANFNLPAVPVPSIGDTLTVTDPMAADSPQAFDLDDTAGDLVWTYGQVFSCGRSRKENNTATGVFGTSAGPSGASVHASAEVDITCKTVTVSKTAQTRFSRDYAWNPDKKIVVRAADVTEQDKATHCSLIADPLLPYAGSYLCDNITLLLNPDGVYDTVYQLNAARTVESESDFAVSGTITVTWPAGPAPAFAGDPSDTLLFAPAVAVNVTGCATNGNSMTCSYSAALTDKTGGTNQASIERPRVCYDVGGNPATCAAPSSSTYVGTASVSFGEPAVSTDSCVALTDLFNAGGLNLGASFGWEINPQLCASGTVYATGDVNPIPEVDDNLSILAQWAPTDFQQFACTFQVPNLLSLSTDNGQTRSDSANIEVSIPLACGSGCTYTQGYWKTHSRYGPAPYDETWATIGEDTLFFNSPKSWHALFWTPPQGGNGYIILAHQYMAARLNLEAGATMPSAIAGALAEATTFFTGGRTEATRLTKPQRENAIRMAGILGAYNEGTTGPGHCSISPKTP